MENLFESISYIHVIKSVIIILVSVLIYKFIIHILEKGEKNAKKTLKANKKRTTYFKLTKSILRYIFLILTILVLLQTNGVNVSSLLAGVGILSAVVGLALQDFIKDIIRGTSILSDEYFSVGDIVKYKENEGKVLLLGLKSTKIKDLKTGNIITIANRNIEQIEVVSNFIYINVPMPYELSVNEAENIINDIVNVVKQNSNTDDCRYIGVSELASSDVKYLLEVSCNPLNKLQVKRDALKSVLVTMEEHKIAVPYQQIDIHNK